jgi:hypothetical protein
MAKIGHNKPKGNRSLTMTSIATATPRLVVLLPPSSLHDLGIDAKKAA